MTPEEIQLVQDAIQLIQDSGIVQAEPGGQSLAIYSMLVIIAALSFRMFVINGIVSKFLKIQEEGNRHKRDILDALTDIKGHTEKACEKVAELVIISTHRRKSDVVKKES